MPNLPNRSRQERKAGNRLLGPAGLAPVRVKRWGFTAWARRIGAFPGLNTSTYRWFTGETRLHTPCNYEEDREYLTKPHRYAIGVAEKYAKKASTLTTPISIHPRSDVRSTQFLKVPWAENWYIPIYANNTTPDVPTLVTPRDKHKLVQNA